MDKKEFKVQKKAFKKAKRKAYGPWKFLSILSGPLAIIFCIVMVVCNMFDNTISLLVGGSFWELENEDPNYTYFEGDFATEEERTAAGAAGKCRLWEDIRLRPPAGRSRYRTVRTTQNRWPITYFSGNLQKCIADSESNSHSSTWIPEPGHPYSPPGSG